MSNEIYRVEIEKVSKGSVTLRLVIRDAESGNLPEGKPWALMLVCEAVYGDLGLASRAIKKAVTKRQSTTEGFLTTSAARYIASVKLVKKRNYPIKDERRYNEEEWSENARTCAWGQYTITFEDPAWSSGLKAGQTWESASYAPYDPGPKVTAALTAGQNINGKGKTFYFTGKFGSMNPGDRRDRVKELGGICARSLTSDLNYLVVGDYDMSLQEKDPVVQRARKLVASGSEVAVITEGAFRAIPTLRAKIAARARAKWS